MELRWTNRKENKIGIAHITDDDENVLRLLGAYHLWDEDCVDEWDNAEVEVWKVERIY